MEKQDGHPGLWLAETFSTSPLKPLNWIQRNLTGSKILTFSTKFVFFGPIGKNKMAALASDWLRHFGLLLLNCCTEFKETWQEERSQRPLPTLCVVGRSENRMAALANPSKRWHIVLRCTICGPLGLLFYTPSKGQKFRKTPMDIVGSKGQGHTDIFFSHFLCPRIEWSGAYCFCPICLSVCLLSTLTFASKNQKPP